MTLLTNNLPTLKLPNKPITQVTFLQRQGGTKYWALNRTYWWAKSKGEYWTLTHIFFIYKNMSHCLCSLIIGDWSISCCVVDIFAVPFFISQLDILKILFESHFLLESQTSFWYQKLCHNPRYLWIHQIVQQSAVEMNDWEEAVVLFESICSTIAFSLLLITCCLLAQCNFQKCCRQSLPPLSDMPPLSEGGSSDLCVTGTRSRKLKDIWLCWAQNKFCLFPDTDGYLRLLPYSLFHSQFTFY